MKILKFLDRRIEEVLLVFILAVMALITFAQVIMRYFFTPLSWSEEMARFLFIWLTYIGVSYGVKHSAHIKIDVLLKIFPHGMREKVKVLGDIVFIGFSIFIVITAFQNSMNILRLGQKSPALGIQMGYVYLAPVVGFALTAIRIIQRVYKKISGKDDDELKREVLI